MNFTLEKKCSMSLLILTHTRCSMCTIVIVTSQVDVITLASSFSPVIVSVRVKDLQGQSLVFQEVSSCDLIIILKSLARGEP